MNKIFLLAINWYIKTRKNLSLYSNCAQICIRNFNYIIKLRCVVLQFFLQMFINITLVKLSIKNSLH